MDPEKTYNQLVEAVDRKDVVAARRLAQALIKWIARGGFVPTTIQTANGLRYLATALYPYA